MPDRLPVARRDPPVLRFGVPVLLVATAAVLTPLIPPIADRATFMLFFLAIAFTGYQLGFGPALVAITGSTIVTGLWLMRGEPAPPPHAPGDWVRLAGFVASAFLIAGLGARSRSIERRERAQREWNEVTLASVGDAVLVTDADGRVRFLNRLAETLTGWSRAEARGRPVHEVFRIVSETTRLPVEDPTAKVRREGQTVGLANHTILVARDGTETPIDDSGAPIWSDDRAVVGCVLVFRDVTERRRGERRREALLERVRAAHAEAQAANRAKDEFLAVLSHELRTPLQAILGWAQVLQSRPLPPQEIARAGEAIERNARRQSRLVEDVLDVSRIVSGKLILKHERVSLGKVITAAIEIVRPSFETKGVTLAADLDDACDVVGDEQRIEQAVWNLLSNAVKFTPAGGAVDVRCARAGDEVEIAVRDTGCGIHPGFLPDVFDRFRQQDGGSTRSHGGLGLGLAIVRHIVEMHGGSVRAESEGPGRGATFTIRLPQASKRLALAEPGLATADAPIDLTGVRVLAVDDEPDARELIDAMLRDSGADVRTAASVDEALAIAASWRPDVVLSDLEMPRADGYALLRALRASGLGDVPAVALSAYATDDHARRAVAEGFARRASKPIGQRELQALIREVYAPR